jgi:TM2 domain-containing membrane protein YozV
MKANGSELIAQRDRRIAAGLAWLGVFIPGVHKFYLGQPVWGVVYLLLSWTPIPRVACAVEGALLLGQSEDAFAQRWGAKPSTSGSVDANHINALGAALRELDALRQEGLISELEFEHKRRQLLDQAG